MVLNVVLIALGLIVLAIVIVLVYAATKPDAFGMPLRPPSLRARRASLGVMFSDLPEQPR